MRSIFLFQQMLVFDPNFRINANEALQHAYFNEYRQNYLSSGSNHFSSNHNQSLGHIANSTNLRDSSSSILTSSSSEDQRNPRLLTEKDHTIRSLPMTQ